MFRKREDTSNLSIEELRARDEARDNTRVTRYVFTLAVGFLFALFLTYFNPRGQEEALLTSELVHFIAGSLFAYLAVIVDRYFKSTNGHANGANGQDTELIRRQVYQQLDEAEQKPKRTVKPFQRLGD